MFWWRVSFRNKSIDHFLSHQIFDEWLDFLLLSPCEVVVNRDMERNKTLFYQGTGLSKKKSTASEGCNPKWTQSCVWTANKNSKVLYVCSALLIKLIHSAFCSQLMSPARRASLKIWNWRAISQLHRKAAGPIWYKWMLFGRRRIYLQGEAIWSLCVGCEATGTDSMQCLCNCLERKQNPFDLKTQPETCSTKHALKSSNWWITSHRNLPWAAISTLTIVTKIWDRARNYLELDVICINDRDDWRYNITYKSNATLFLDAFQHNDRYVKRCLILAHTFMHSLEHSPKQFCIKPKIDQQITIISQGACCKWKTLRLCPYQ